MGEHEEQEQGEEQSCELGHVGREGWRVFKMGKEIEGVWMEEGVREGIYIEIRKQMEVWTLKVSYLL